MRQPGPHLLLPLLSSLFLWPGHVAAAAGQEPEQPTFGVEAELVLVDVSVTRDGAPVPVPDVDVRHRKGY